MVDIIYTPWLHFHQPLVWWKASQKERLVGNLFKMMQGEPNSEELWNSKLISRAYKNPASHILRLFGEGLKPRIMLDFSGTLLQSLYEMSYSGVFDSLNVQGEVIGNIIELYKNAMAQCLDAIEIAGTAYYHCYFPATPVRDWEAQVETWRELYAKIFGSKALERVKGFWLPELGVPDEAKMAKLVRILKRSEYQWLILPPYVIEVEGSKNVESQSHLLIVKDEIGEESIPIICRDTTMGIRQMEGCDASGVFNDLRWRARENVGRKPAIAVPASDGENGNAMLNLFFPNTFEPFYRKIKSHSWAEAMTVTEFLNIYHPSGLESIARIKGQSGSWIGGHDSWMSGQRRREMLGKIDAVSLRFSKLPKSKEQQYQEVLHAVLATQTSCYVYWESEYWFEQARKTVAYAHSLIDKL